MTAIRGYVAPTNGERCARRALARPVRARRSRRRRGAGVLRQFRPRRPPQRQHAGDQDLRPRSPLGLGGGGRQEQGAAPSVVRLLRRGLAAAEGAHRGAGHQADRPAAGLRKQRLLVPQPRRRADRGEGRAQGVARPEGGQPMDHRRPGRRRRHHPRQGPRRAAAPAVACADLHHATSTLRSSSTSARSACACPTAPPTSSPSCTASTAAIITCWRW